MTGFAGFGQVGLGALFITLSAFLYRKNRAPTVRSVLVFFGIMLVGLNGWLLTKAAALIELGITKLGDLAGPVIGFGGPVVFLCVTAWMVFEVAHSWLPRNKAGKGTYWVSMLLAIMCVAGITPVAALNNLPSTVTQISQAG